MRRKVVTSLIGMVNISIGQQLIFLPDASEATPMPRPLSVPLRQEIVRRRQQGLPLTQIAADLAIPYGTVRNIWRLYRRHDREGLAPDYRSCGRPVPPPIQELLRIACDLKREHPVWGAGLIRLQLRKHCARSRPPLGPKSPTRLRPSRSQSAAAPPCGRRRGPPSSPTPRDLASRRRRECAVSHRPAHLLADGDR